MSCKIKENNILGYIELPEGYWVMTTTADVNGEEE